MRISRRKLIPIIATGLFAFISGLLLFPRRSDVAQPWSGVVEPITIVNSISWDDGGSCGLEFRDARNTTRYACLLNDLDGNKNLVLGRSAPISDKNELANWWPIGGPKEKGFLQLLERWAASDPDAQEWDRRFALHEQGKLDINEIYSRASEEQQHKAMAVIVKRQLRRRQR